MKNHYTFSPKDPCADIQGSFKEDGRGLLSLLKLAGIAVFLILLSIQSGYADTQPYTLEGVVYDEYGTAMPGVNIVLKDTEFGTSTDLEGKFLFPIEVKEGDVLVFSFVGYESKEYVVQAQNSPNINMEMIMDQFTILGESASNEVFSSRPSGIWSKIRSWFK